MLILDVLTFFTHFVSVWFWILNRKLWINHLFLLFLSMQGLLNCKTECHSNWSENFIWHKCTSHSQFNQSKHEQGKKVIPVVYLLLTYFVFLSVIWVVKWPFLDHIVMKHPVGKNTICDIFTIPNLYGNIVKLILAGKHRYC